MLCRVPISSSSAMGSGGCCWLGPVEPAVGIATCCAHGSCWPSPTARRTPRSRRTSTTTSHTGSPHDPDESMGRDHWSSRSRPRYTHLSRGCLGHGCALSAGWRHDKSHTGGAAGRCMSAAAGLERIAALHVGTSGRSAARYRASGSPMTSSDITSGHAATTKLESGTAGPTGSRVTPSHWCTHHKINSVAKATTRWIG
jgi:hypothetical protein